MGKSRKDVVVSKNLPPSADPASSPFAKKRTISDAQRKKIAEQACRTAIDDLAAWTSIYEMSIELRNFEINQLVQRNNFFMIFQGVLFAGICQSAGQVPIVSFTICAVGGSVGLLQAGMAAGAKYWQEHWEMNSQLSEDAMIKLLQRHRVYRYLNDRFNINIDPVIDQKLLNRHALIRVFVDDSNRRRIEQSIKSGRPRAWISNWMILKRFSASRIPIYVGLVLAAGWLLLLTSTLKFDFLNIHAWSAITGFPQRG